MSKHKRGSLFLGVIYLLIGGTILYEIGADLSLIQWFLLGVGFSFIDKGLNEVFK